MATKSKKRPMRETYKAGQEIETPQGDRGILDLRLGRVGTVISVVIGAVLVLTILGGMTDVYFDALQKINDNLTDPNTTTGDNDADDLLTAFPPIVGIIGVVGFLILVFSAFAFANRRGNL